MNTPLPRNVAPIISPDEKLAFDLAKKWGWEEPNSQILTIAKTSLKMRSAQVGRILVAFKAITEDQLKTLLAEQPEGQKFLQYAANKIPTVRPYIDRILCLKSGSPFYESFDGLFTLHPLMDDQAVYNATSALDAVLLLTGEKQTIMVFSSMAQFTNYTTAGTAAKQIDPIRNALLTYNYDETKSKNKSADLNQLYCGLGNRGEVINYLTKSKQSKKEESQEASTEKIWLGSSASTPEQQILARMLDACIENKVTDMAITPQRSGGATNRMRRYGDLIKMPIAFLTEEQYRPILGFLMSRSGANREATRKFYPTDGQLTYRSGSGDVFLRLSFIPMNHPGSDLDMQSISVRFFPRVETSINLEDLGIDPAIADEIGMAARFRQGLILLCGGTNTGKSTTIAAALGENIRFHGEKLKRVSVEQPVERYLKGVSQFNILETLKVDSEIVDGFKLYLRALKRHDPDVIWVGEIRDQESADVCVASAITGHLVFSTIHANNTILGYDNLSKMVHADHRYQFVEALSLIVAQDLVKCVCAKCGVVEAPTEYEHKMFKAASKKYGFVGEIPKKVIHAKENGCNHCEGTGFTGVKPINEVLVCTKEVKEAMLDMLSNINVTASRSIIENARSHTLFTSAMRLVNSFEVELESIVI